LTHEKGQPNYNVYASEPNEKVADTSSASLMLERIDIKTMNLSYTNQSTKIVIVAKGLNYLGKGDLNEAVFDLKTNAQIESFALQSIMKPISKIKK
jgi:AsmA protein